MDYAVHASVRIFAPIGSDFNDSRSKNMIKFSTELKELLILENRFTDFSIVFFFSHFKHIFFLLIY